MVNSAEIMKFSFICMFTSLVLLFGCAPKSLHNYKTDDWGCSIPPPDVFLVNNISLDFVQTIFSRFTIGAINLDTHQEVVSLASRSSTDRRLADYSRCLATKRDGYTKEQAMFLDRLLSFMSTKPTAQQYLDWIKIDPFPGEVPEMMGDVIISAFPGDESPNGVNISGRLEADLREKLDQHGLEKIRINVVKNLTSSEAESLASKGVNKVVIWGWRDELDVHVRIIFGKSDSTEAVSIRKEDFQLSDLPTKDLRIVFRNTIPETTSFISLFTLGHLKFIGNNYLGGKKAFDAAMKQIPDNVTLNNKYLVSFFSARLLAEIDPSNEGAITCGLAETIKQNPSFFPAYNNLAKILADHSYKGISEKGYECLASIKIMNEEYSNYENSIGSDFTEKILEKALLLSNSNNFIRYNLLAFRWHKFLISYEEENLVYEQLIEITNADASILGAHLLLAELAFRRAEYNLAEKHLQKALVLSPASAEILVNTGHVQSKLNKFDEAFDSYNEAIQIDSKESEAQLGIAGIYIRKKIFAEAEKHLRIEKLKEDYDYREIATRIDFILEVIKSQPSAEKDIWKKITEQISDADRILNPIESTFESDLFRNVAVGCKQREFYKSLSDIDYPSKCLPASLHQRINILLKAISTTISERYIERVYDGPDGMACPYVYTINPNYEKWEFETAIIKSLDSKSKETLQRQKLSRFNGKIMIKEVEPEISYINELFIEVIDQFGQKKRFHSSNEALRNDDEHYFIMNMGDEIILDFPNYSNLNYESISIYAQGYYTRLDH